MELQTQGNSDSSQRRRTRSLFLFDVFRKQVGEPELLVAYPSSFNELDEETVASQKIYNQFGHWLLNVYKQEDGTFLDDNTVLPYVRSLINQAATRFKHSGSAASKFFFTCLDLCAPLPLDHH